MANWKSHYVCMSMNDTIFVSKAFNSNHVKVYDIIILSTTGSLERTLFHIFSHYIFTLMYLLNSTIFPLFLQDSASAPSSESAVCYKAEILPHTHHTHRDARPVPTREAYPTYSGTQSHPW